MSFACQKSLSILTKLFLLNLHSVRRTRLQIFALEVAIRLGNDVDMPRNLAKSVTVE
ncbi:MAG: hypothetical protein SPJ16_00035 [Helicobacter sp.]|nr:hypothetical protein [Helicobacter sp.]